MADPLEELVPAPLTRGPDPDMSLDEFFPPAFMAEHTRFDTFGEFRSGCPVALDDRSTLEEPCGDELDAYVDRTTGFDSWRTMRNAAAEREIYERLLV